MIGAIEAGLGFNKGFTDAMKEGIAGVQEPCSGHTGPGGGLVNSGSGEKLFYGCGNMAGKPLENRRHAQFSLAAQDLLLKLAVGIDPMLW